MSCKNNCNQGRSCDCTCTNQQSEDKADDRVELVLLALTLILNVVLLCGVAGFIYVAHGDAIARLFWHFATLFF